MIIPKFKKCKLSPSHFLFLLFQTLICINSGCVFSGFTGIKKYFSKIKLYCYLHIMKFIPVFLMIKSHDIKRLAFYLILYN